MNAKKQILGTFLPFAAAFALLAGGCGAAGKTTAPALTGEPIGAAPGPLAYGTPSPASETQPEDSAMDSVIDSVINQEMISETISEAKEEAAGEATEAPAPGVKTLENFLRTALLPLGSTMYVWGGGWNEEDTGAGEEARTLGVSPRWAEFAAAQDASYEYRSTRYQIHDGLDCSGYVGWAVYNTMETENLRPGYVCKSTDAASLYAAEGWGEFLPADRMTPPLPGDIMSMNGHVWISLGTCPDGSALILHSSPPGVRLCGTAESGKSSQASELAQKYMSAYFPDWYARYPDCTAPTSYLKNTSQMRWNTETFPDAETLRALSPEELLEKLFP